MCEAKDIPPSERDELMGLVTQLQGQVTYGRRLKLRNSKHPFEKHWSMQLSYLIPPAM